APGLFILRSFYGLFGPLRLQKIPQKAGFCGTWVSFRSPLHFGQARISRSSLSIIAFTFLYSCRSLGSAQTFNFR
ncbi:hypothetical protein, partial [Candidatus Hakubella thermalkaliphila]